MQTSSGFKFDVFLSHNPKDKPRVRKLAQRLRAAGLRVWFDEWNIKHGDIIALKENEGLEQSRVQLLCISPNALASGWIALERSTAIHRDPANAGRHFIPLLLADCELPHPILKYSLLDFRDGPAVVTAKLLRICTHRQRRKTEGGATRRPSTAQSESPPIPFLMEGSLIGHGKWVQSVALNRSGDKIASASYDGTTRIWNLEKQRCLYIFGELDAPFFSACFDLREERVFAASGDGTILRWSLKSGKMNLPLRGHRDEVRAIASLAKSNRIISVSLDRTVFVWDLEKRKPMQSMRGVSPMLCVAVCEDLQLAVTGDIDGTVSVWNFETGELEVNLRGHTDGIQDVLITQDGSRVISASRDKTIKIWNLREGAAMATLEGHTSGVNSISLAPNGHILASASSGEGAIRLWDIRSGGSVRIDSIGHSNSPTSVAFHPDGSRLVVSHIWDIKIIKLGHLDAIMPVAKASRYVNAKIALIGETTVGKTTLAHRLIHDRYIKAESTHGMSVWRLNLKDATSQRDRVSNRFEREALLWDFAGQDDYRLIHQIFLEETALALLLINPQKDNPFAEVGDWLRALQTADTKESRREIPKLLITTRSDVGGIKVSRRKIEQFLKDHEFADWLPTGAKRGDNCSDSRNGGQPSKLKKLIADHIPWEKLPWTTTPQLLAKIKRALAAMRDEKEIRLLRFAELSQRLEQSLPGETFGEEDVRTAITLLANHGLVRSLKFGDLVLLQPELLNGYAGAVIRAAREHTDEIGCVSEANIYKSDFDFTGVERLNQRADEELLLRALVQTFLDRSLCIAEDTPEGRHLVFPSQYRQEKDMPHDPDIFVSYTFSGEWQTVWTTLVVRLWYSQEFKRRELWRNAAEFATSRSHTLGLKIDNRQGEGTATISLYFDRQVEDVLKAIFIEYVHRHLAKYGCEVSRDRRYVCPKCGKPVTDLDAVRTRLHEKKGFITCQQCDEQVPLIDFIEQRLNSDPVARKILAMDEITTRELDTQALEQILIGHMMAIAGEANQIFRPLTMFDYGIDGEVEFKDNDGKASGRRIYIQLKSGNSYVRTRKRDGSEVFAVKSVRHLEYWVNQPVDVYLVTRQTDEIGGGQLIRWMNVTRYLKARKDKKSRQIVFDGERLDMEAVWKVRDDFFPTTKQQR